MRRLLLNRGDQVNNIFIHIFSSSSSHHHLLELIKVHGAWAILVHLLNDVIQVILCQGRVDLSEDLLQHLIGDEPLPLLVVDPEGLLKLLLHLLLIILNHKLGGNLQGDIFIINILIFLDFDILCSHLTKHHEREFSRLLLVDLRGVVVHIWLVDLHTHALEDHHHRGLVDGAAILVKTVITLLQRVNLQMCMVLLSFAIVCVNVWIRHWKQACSLHLFLEFIGFGKFWCRWWAERECTASAWPQLNVNYFEKSLTNFTCDNVIYSVWEYCGSIGSMIPALSQFITSLLAPHLIIWSRIKGSKLCCSHFSLTWRAVSQTGS